MYLKINAPLEVTAFEQEELFNVFSRVCLSGLPALCYTQLLNYSPQILDLNVAARCVQVILELLLWRHRRHRLDDWK